MRILSLVLFTATACTGSIGNGNGTGDDDPPVPPSTDVQIRVRDANTPVVGATVIFQNLDESLIAEVQTDATGTATAEMPAGGNLTVIRTFPLTLPVEESRKTEIYTYLSVEAGDRLELGDAVDELATPAAINVMVPDNGNNANYTIKTPCGTGQGTGPLIPLTVRGCSSQLTVYVTDQDNSSFVKTMPYSNLVDVSTEALRGKLSSQILATNVTPGSQVIAEKRLVMGNFALFSSGEKRVDQTAQNVDLPTLTGIEELQLTRVVDPTNHAHMVAERKAYAQGTTSVDGSIGIIPSIETPNYSPTGLSWVEAGTGGAASVTLATLTITRDLGDGVPPGPNDVYIRSIVAPHTGATLRMPLLPGTGAQYNPGATDQIAGSLGIAQFTGDYAAARPVVFTAPSLFEVAPLGGRVVMSYTGNTPPGL